MTNIVHEATLRRWQQRGLTSAVHLPDCTPIVGLGDAAALCQKTLVGAPLAVDDDVVVVRATSVD
jgi:hypothetical protein